MNKNIILTIKHHLKDLSKSERQVGQFIIDYPEKVVNMKVSELADEAGSSPATIIRLCQKIGLSGYTNLKISLSRNLSMTNDDLYTDIEAGETVDQVSGKLLSNMQHYLQETADLIDEETIESVADVISQASTIYLYGLGASHLVATDIKQKLSRIGKRVVLSLDQHELAAGIALPQENAIYIGVSNSGERIEGKKLMELANSHGLTTVALSQNQGNTLAGLADYNLRTPVIQNSALRTDATIIMMAQLYVVAVLYYRFFTKDYDGNLERITQSFDGIQSLESLFLN